MPVSHVHLGPGKLGLGLILFAGAQAGFDIHLVARRESKLTPETTFQLAVHGDGEVGQATLPSVRLSKASSFGELDPETKRAIQEAPRMLITTALGTQGLAQCCDLIAEIGAARPRGSEFSTSFIAAENDPGSAYGRLEEILLQGGIDCRPTMVNRLCMDGDDLGTGVREIRVDGIMEWVIGGQASSGTALQRMETLPFVKFVPDVRPYELRKRWMVNGGHLALAIFARAAGYLNLNEASAEPGRSEWLARLLKMLSDAVEARYPGFGSIQYGEQHVNVWSRHPDPAKRVVSRLKRADLLPFFQDLERKLTEPLTYCVHEGLADEKLVSELVEALHGLLSTLDQFVDVKDVRKHRVALNEKTDEAALVLYHDWVERLVGPARAEFLTDQLAATFARDRDAVG